MSWRLECASEADQHPFFTLGEEGYWTVFHCHGQGVEGVSGGEFWSTGHMVDSFPLSVAVTSCFSVFFGDGGAGFVFSSQNYLKTLRLDMTVHRVSAVGRVVERKWKGEL